MSTDRTTASRRPTASVLRNARSDSSLSAPLGAWISGACLLEPCVGVFWQRSFASNLEQPLDVSRSILLACSVWLVYTLDHWLDVRRCPNVATHSQRHRFVAEHGSALEASWLAVLSFVVALAASVLSPAEWLCAGLLLFATAAYLAVVHLSRVPAVPKELLVALIFSAGISLFHWPTLSTWPVSAALAIASFGALALLNVGVISVAERGADALLGEPTLALDHPALQRWVLPAAAALTLLAAVSLSLGWNFEGWQLGIALSALSLAALCHCWRRLETNLLHRLADAALLLPLAAAWLW